MQHEQRQQRQTAPLAARRSITSPNLLIDLDALPARRLLDDRGTFSTSQHKFSPTRPLHGYDPVQSPYTVRPFLIYSSWSKSRHLLPD